MLLLIIVLPLMQFDLLLRRKLGLSHALALRLSLLPLALWLRVFYKVGEAFPIVSSEAELEGDSLLYEPALRTLGTAGVMGVWVTAVMSGYVAVSSPARSISRHTHA